MRQFLLGFALASALGTAALWAQGTGRLELFTPAGDEVAKITLVASDHSVDKKSDDTRKTGKRRGKRKTRAGGRRDFGDRVEYDTSEGLSGDDLGGPGSRELSMGSEGGEEQLKEAEIDRGIDRVFSGIERCLVLVPAGAPASGKVVVGMKIASTGQVREVNLKGPRTIVSGEAGACIRRIVKSIRYPSFDGPDMVAHYPIVFE